MTLFRPCIDLHNGKVKQIVGSTLNDSDNAPSTNFVADTPSSYFAEMYKRDNAEGGHVIKLGPGNDEAAKEALMAYPGGMHIGGGIDPSNCRQWIKAGASKVIVTSYLFTGLKLDMNKVKIMSDTAGRDALVIDLSCRSKDQRFYVATNRWQTTTTTEINSDILNKLSLYCSEFLIHAADVEGMCRGIDYKLVELLGRESPVPCTYAGGAKSVEDLETVKKLSNGRVDLTFGSALDIFGGTLVNYSDCIDWNKKQA
ncbi:MAG: phosphoribosylformimino-5-aminoimidazole carboxamide ribotide isomerase [Deltaproteobacteria bacterium]|nr:phosphoribosylformimino-5-aminoimidazole carboxamide ribotide isomerase [Deltaproteobacteria bacterium]